MGKYERRTGKIVVWMSERKDTTERIVVICWKWKKKRNMMVVDGNFTHQ